MTTDKSLAFTKNQTDSEDSRQRETQRSPYQDKPFSIPTTGQSLTMKMLYLKTRSICDEDSSRKAKKCVTACFCYLKTPTIFLTKRWYIKDENHMAKLSQEGGNQDSRQTNK